MHNYNNVWQYETYSECTVYVIYNKNYSECTVI